MADTIRPHCGDRLLEIGSGIGNFSRTLLPRSRYVATDINPLYLHTLENLAVDRPYLSASYCDVTDLASYPHTSEGFDTVVCLNVLEHVDDDRQALLNIRSVLTERGARNRIGSPRAEEFRDHGYSSWAPPPQRALRTSPPIAA